MRGRIVTMPALRLFGTIPAHSVNMVILDPPQQLGIGEAEDETPIDEMMSGLGPIAEHVYRVLTPGASVVFTGSPQQVSAWDVVTAWNGLAFVADMTILWDTAERKDRSGKGTWSLTTPVRWHLKPGYRGPNGHSTYVSSNVILCRAVPDDERVVSGQKPVELYNFFVSLLTSTGDTVMDPFCGSGAALVAAEMCEREWIGGDLDPRCVAVAARRVAKADVEAAQLQPLALWHNNGNMAVEG